MFGVDLPLLLPGVAAFVGGNVLLHVALSIGPDDESGRSMNRQVRRMSYSFQAVGGIAAVVCFGVFGL